MSQYVYVVTEAEPFDSEKFVAVKSTFEDAEKVVYAKYPNAKVDRKTEEIASYLCKRNGFVYVSFIRRHELA